MAPRHSRVDSGGSSGAVTVALSPEEHAHVQALPGSTTEPNRPCRTGAPSSIRESQRYLAIEEIGRGAMGVVIRAYDSRLRRELALKVVQPTALSEELRVRMLREAQAMAKLAHPNVVAVYDVEIGQRDVVIAMELVQGTTLAEWLEIPRPWREILAMFRAAGRALAAAHAAGLLHRDFKPANVLVGTDGRPRVTDFGLVRMHDEHVAPAIGELAGNGDITVDGTVLGTPRYMAPEQLAGAELDSSADQYAFCVALWCALVGRPPFETAMAKELGPPAWPRHVALPRPIREAIRRGLAAAPSERWPSMDALLAALSSERHMHRTWLLAGGAALAALTGGSMYSYHQRQLAERCTGAADQLRQVWDGERAKQIRQAFSAAPSSHAVSLGENVILRLDAYASDWALRHTETCLATAVRQEQTERVMDLEMRCLHRARGDLQAVAELFVQADATIVEKSERVLETLPALADCADAEALEINDIPPPTPNQRAAVEKAMVELAAATALYNAGKFFDALARMQQVVAQAKDISYGPLSSEVMVMHGHALMAASDHEGAESALREGLRTALENGQRQVGREAATKLVHLLGWQSARPAEALAYAETARALLGVDADPTEEAAVLSELGGVLDRLGRYREAEAHYRAAVDLARRGWGRGHVHVGVYLNNLGVNLDTQARYEEAERVYLESLALREKALPPEHPSIVLVRQNLAGLLYVRQRWREAETGYRWVVDILQRTLGDAHRDTALARGQLANALSKQGRDEEALVEFEAALAVERQIPANPGLPIVLASQGEALAKLGRNEAAEAVLREALEITLTRDGADHPEVARYLVMLGWMLVRSGRLAEGEAELRHAIDILRNAGSSQPHHALPRALVELARALQEQNHHELAEAELRDAFELAQKLWGLEHLQLVAIRNGLGTTLAARNRHDEAEREHRAALALQLEHLEPNHPNVAQTRRLLGNTLRAAGRHDEAIAELEAAVTGLRSYASNHPSLAELERDFARALLGQGKLREAHAVLVRAWKTWKADARITVAERLALADDLARVSRAVGQRGRARNVSREARALTRPAG